MASLSPIVLANQLIRNSLHGGLKPREQGRLVMRMENIAGQFQAYRSSNVGGHQKAACGVQRGMYSENRRKWASFHQKHSRLREKQQRGRLSPFGRVAVSTGSSWRSVSKGWTRKDMEGTHGSVDKWGWKGSALICRMSFRSLSSDFFFCNCRTSISQLFCTRQILFSHWDTYKNFEL